MACRPFYRVRLGTDLALARRVFIAMGIVDTAYVASVDALKARIADHASAACCPRNAFGHTDTVRTHLSRSAAGLSALIQVRGTRKHAFAEVAQVSTFAGETTTTAVVGVGIQVETGLCSTLLKTGRA